MSKVLSPVPGKVWHSMLSSVSGCQILIDVLLLGYFCRSINLLDATICYGTRVLPSQLDAWLGLTSESLAPTGGLAGCWPAYPPIPSPVRAQQDALSLCQFNSNQPPFKLLVVSQSARSVPPHPRLQAWGLLRSGPRLHRDPCWCSGRRRHGGGGGRGWSCAWRTSPTSR
jgi:hypothetical protein